MTRLFRAAAMALASLASQSGPVAVVSFPEKNGPEPYNASGVVPVGDSRFLFCDNHAGDALYEFETTATGAKKGPILRRALEGVGTAPVADLESLAMATENGERFVFAASSLNATTDKKRGAGQPADGLLRVRYTPEGALRAEAMPGFRAWLVARVPRIAKTAALVPDEGGLNVEGLAWDPARHALLLGLRSPLADGRPVILPLRVKDLAGAWRTENLEVLPEIRLEIAQGRVAQGIRDIAYDPDRKSFLVLVGRSVSGTEAPFQLYAWDGGAEGAVRPLPAVTFPPKMKPEGVTAGTVGGRPALVFVDDRGGYGVLWDEGRSP